MVKNYFDKKELLELGIAFATDEETMLFSEIIQKEFEVRVGMEITEGLTDEQVQEFESAPDMSFAVEWLNKNRPNYKEICTDVKTKLKSELVKYRSEIPGIIECDYYDDDFEDEYDEEIQ